MVITVGGGVRVFKRRIVPPGAVGEVRVSVYRVPVKTFNEFEEELWCKFGWRPREMFVFLKSPIPAVDIRSPKLPLVYCGFDVVTILIPEKGIYYVWVWDKLLEQDDPVIMATAYYLWRWAFRDLMYLWRGKVPPKISKRELEVFEREAIFKTIDSFGLRETRDAFRKFIDMCYKYDGICAHPLSLEDSINKFIWENWRSFHQRVIDIKERVWRYLRTEEEELAKRIVRLRMRWYG